MTYSKDSGYKKPYKKPAPTHQATRKTNVHNAVLNQAQTSHQQVKVYLTNTLSTDSTMPGSVTGTVVFHDDYTVGILATPARQMVLMKSSIALIEFL
jgi:sRNA-binding regulator protein Hfq